SGRLQVSFQFVILSGEYKNRKLWSHQGLETAENMGWFKAMLAKLELKIPKKLKDLPDILEEAIDLTCEVTVKTRGEYQNVYVNKLIDPDEDVEEDEDE